YPDLCQSHIDVVRTEIARASGRAATIADVEKWTDDFRRSATILPPRQPAGSQWC
ncbi:terminase small subunit, partial [Salmonella enterica]|nr:terminase small subunit [Salmonella enterica]